MWNNSDNEELYRIANALEKINQTLLRIEQSLDSKSPVAVVPDVSTGRAADVGNAGAWPKYDN